MNDFQRLLNDDATDFERALLGSAMADRGSPVARERAVRASAAALAITAQSLGATATPSTLAVSGLVKWGVTGVLLGTVVVSTTRLLQPSPELPRHGSTVTAPPIVVDVAPRRRPEQPSFASSPAAQPSPSAEVVVEPELATRSSRATRPPAPSAAPESSLALELATLREARSALATGNGKQALRALDRYAASFAHPTLQPEATLLRIEALLATGARGPAASLADRFLTEQPSGAHADRARQLRARATSSD